jgi:hypothetical protein
VNLTSAGAPASASAGQYSIAGANAQGGTFNPSNYSIRYAFGTLQVIAPVVPPPDPVKPPPISPGDIQQIIGTINQSGDLASTPGSDTSSGNEQAVISGFGIQRLNMNTFFGEQLLLPGGALMIDDSGVGPALPIGEAPPNLEDTLAEDPHEMLEEAIAEDDGKKKTQNKRLYELSPGELMTADTPGEVRIDPLKEGPADLQRATNEQIESLLLPAARL